MNRIKSIIIVMLLIVSGYVIVGCKQETFNSKKIKDVEFTVVQLGDIPTELEQQITNRRNSKFNFTYILDGYMYICLGYGKQATGGYSINVKELYETKNAICVSTTLIGPEENELVLKANSYPYIILKIKNIDKNILYNT